MRKKEMFDSAKRTVVEAIAELCKTGEERLVPARQLAEQAGCSFGTMRLVMAELEKEGYIRQQQGSGTYVTEQAPELAGRFLIRRLLFIRPPHFGTYENSYHEWMGRNFEEEAARRGWAVTTVTVRSHDEFLTCFRDMGYGVDAVCYAPVSEAFSLGQVAELWTLRDRPFVIFNDYLDTTVHCVTIDNRRGGAMAASLLLEANHRKIGLVFSEPHSVRPCVERSTGFLETLELAGVKPEIIDVNVSRDDNRQVLTYKKMRERLKHPLDLTALFAVSDAGAWGVLEALHDAGISVPDTVSVIGFDGLPYDERIKPRLTTIRQPLEAIFNQVFAVIERRNSNSQYRNVFSPILVPGETVRRLPDRVGRFRRLADRVLVESLQ